MALSYRTTVTVGVRIRRAGRSSPLVVGIRLPAWPPPRVFVARMVGLAVFGPDGERIGKVRDAVVSLRVDANPPRVLGLVVELATRRRIFVPMLRVTGVDPGAITLATGSVSLRQFTQRLNETWSSASCSTPRSSSRRPARR